MEFECKENIKIEEGIHIGVITKVEYRTEPFNYTDVFISMDNGKVELKTGYPSTVSKDSSLGLLLERFGVILKVKSKYDPEKILVGKKVSFMTMDEKKGDKTYANIIRDSVKPTK